MAPANALLFNRDAVEELDAWRETLPRIGRSSVLWIDLDKPDEQEIDHLAEELGLGADTRERLTPPTRPAFSSRGDPRPDTSRAGGDLQLALR
ncbi:MAG TPA: hypothetical protein VMK83_07675 [Gaiellaceae bacterium]|nr:hypothetical protein [Gaiellaceae bacterium]